MPAAPDLPGCVEQIWGWFWSLSAQRRSGPEPIAFSEIHAWARLSGESPTPDQVRLLLAMDSAWMNAMTVELRAMHDRTLESSKSKSRKSRKGK